MARGAPGLPDEAQLMDGLEHQPELGPGGLGKLCLTPLSFLRLQAPFSTM